MDRRSKFTGKGPPNGPPRQSAQTHYTGIHGTISYYLEKCLFNPHIAQENHPPLTARVTTQLAAKQTIS